MDHDSNDHFHGSQMPQSSCDFDSASPGEAPTVVTARRKSHGPKRSEDYIPRPPNSFMLFRSDFTKRKIIPSKVEDRQNNLSRIAGACWKGLSPAEREVWRGLAREAREEHARKYPRYKYTPTKRDPVQKKRWKPMTREEEIDYCESLRTTYIPDKPTSTQKLQTRATCQKSSCAAKMSPPEPPPAPSSPFMNPLRPPKHHHSPAPTLQSSGHPTPASSHASLESAFESPIFGDFLKETLQEDELKAESDWTHRQDSTSPRLYSPAIELTPHESAMLDTIARIRERSDLARRGALVSIASTPMESHNTFERSAFTPPGSMQSAPGLELDYLAARGAQDHSSGNSVGVHGFTSRQCQYLPSPFVSTSIHPPDQCDSPPPRSKPRRFPITFEASGPLEPLQLQPPIFEMPNQSQDSLILSFDESVLEKGFGLEGQLGLFDGQVQLSLGENSGGDWLSGHTEDLLRVDVCSIEN